MSALSEVLHPHLHCAVRSILSLNLLADEFYGNEDI